MHEVTFSGKTFKLERLDALTLLRIFKILARIGEKGKAALVELAELESASLAAWLGPLLALVAAIGEDDLLRLTANLLQFKDETEGVDWLTGQRMDLDELAGLIAINIDLTSDVVEVVLQNFPLLRGLTGSTPPPDQKTESPPS